MTDNQQAARELLPCPFCNGEADVQCSFGAWIVACLDCGADGPRPMAICDDFDEERAEVVAAWNRRPTPPDSGDAR